MARSSSLSRLPLSLRSSLSPALPLSLSLVRPSLSVLFRSFRAASSSSIPPPLFSSNPSSSTPAAHIPVRPSALELLEAARENENANSKRPIQLKGIKHDGSSPRFYTSTGVQESVNPNTNQKEYFPMLSGRVIETARGNLLSVPSKPLALALALEWQSQRTRIVPSTMPLMSLAVTAIDLARPDKAAFLSHFESSIQIDHICVRVDSPPALVKLQRKHWDPIVKYTEQNWGIQLIPTTEFNAPAISEADKDRMREILRHQNEWVLAALDNATTVTKSLAIALALLTGKIPVKTAADAARVDENYQMKQYGRVEGIYGHGVDIEYTRMQLAASRVFIDLLNLNIQV